MASKWLEAKLEAEQNNLPPKEPAPQSNPTGTAVLLKEITELKELVEHLSESEERKLNDNFEYMINDISRQLEREIVKEIQPMITAQKQEIQKLDVSINSVKEKVNFFFWISGFKEFLFWLSILCNIGVVGYLIYTLVDWSKIV